MLALMLVFMLVLTWLFMQLVLAGVLWRPSAVWPGAKRRSHPPVQVDAIAQGVLLRFNKLKLRLRLLVLLPLGALLLVRVSVLLAE